MVEKSGGADRYRAGLPSCGRDPLAGHETRGIEQGFGVPRAPKRRFSSDPPIAIAHPTLPGRR